MPPRLHFSKQFPFVTRSFDSSDPMDHGKGFVIVGFILEIKLVGDSSYLPGDTLHCCLNDVRELPVSCSGFPDHLITGYLLPVVYRSLLPSPG